jgi:hypothetical protein
VRYYSPPAQTFENQIRLGLAKVISDPWKSGVHLDKARQLLDSRRKSEKRILRAAMNCYVGIHQALPIAWNGNHEDY